MTGKEDSKPKIKDLAWVGSFITKEKIAQIALKEKKSLPKDYKDLVGDFGTLVIWSDIDRIEASFTTSKLKHWLGRTFRKYIGDKIIENK